MLSYEIKKMLDRNLKQFHISPYNEIKRVPMFEFVNITKALAEENRLRILMALEGEELCVCQLIELLELAPSTVSKHVSVLRQARLVEGRKDGRWMYYYLADKSAPSEVTEAIAWVKKSLSGNSRILKDAKRLKDILKIDREVLCRRQTASGADETTQVAQI